MTELLKFVILAGVLIGIVKGIDVLCRISARRLNLNQKILTKAVMITVFLVASYLWMFTGFYNWVSSITGIPLEK